MAKEKVPADYNKMDLVKAKKFDKKVKQNFMPAINSTVKQVIEDYGELEGIGVDIGCGTAIFAIELCKKTQLQLYALEKEKAIYEVANENIKKEGLEDRITTVLGDAHDLPFENEFADFIISRGAFHCWENRVKVFNEIYRVLNEGGIAFIGGGFGRYVNEEDLKRMESLRKRSLKENVKAYNSPDILKKTIEKADMEKTSIIEDKAGYWVEIKK